MDSQRHAAGELKPQPEPGACSVVVACRLSGRATLGGQHWAVDKGRLEASKRQTMSTYEPATSPQTSGMKIVVLRSVPFTVNIGQPAESGATANCAGFLFFSISLSGTWSSFDWLSA